MNVVDRHAETVVRKLWKAVADNSFIPKFINKVSQQLPKSNSNIFNMPLREVRNPRWTHVHKRKQPIWMPFRFFLPRCTCSFGIPITVGIAHSLLLQKPQNFTKWTQWRRKWCDRSLLRSQPFYMNTEDWLKYVSLAHWFLSPGGHNHLFYMRVKKEREKIIYGRIPCNGLTYISVNYKYRLFLFIYVPYIWCIEKKYMWAHHKEKMYTGEFLKLWDEMKFLLFTKSREWGKRATC